MRYSTLTLLLVAIGVATLVRARADEPPFGERRERVAAFAFSPDGAYLAILEDARAESDDRTGKDIKLFNTAGDLVQRLGRGTRRYQTLSFSSDGTRTRHEKWQVRTVCANGVAIWHESGKMARFALPPSR